MNKKMLQIFILIIFAFSLGACTKHETNNEWAVLPNLNGKTEDEVRSLLTDLNIEYQIEYIDTQNKTYSDQFIMYINHNIGDVVSSNEVVTMQFYPLYQPDTLIIIPNLEGKTASEIMDLLDSENIFYYIKYIDITDQSLDNVFAGYEDHVVVGNTFNNISALVINVYKYFDVATEYFEVVDMVYDGPYLNEEFLNQDYLDPRGGAFPVALLRCTDGDTAKFHYPTDIYNAINSSAKSTRFLNMDTEETYPGGEEEWGKPASNYTCSLLQSASSIVLQTDPGDALLDAHGRLLSWVWIRFDEDSPYQLLNYMVVRQGLAQVKYEFGSGENLVYENNTYNQWMHIAEDKAKTEELGQWGNYLDYYWNYETNEPYYDRWN